MKIGANLMKITMIGAVNYAYTQRNSPYGWVSEFFPAISLANSQAVFRTHSKDTLFAGVGHF